MDWTSKKSIHYKKVYSGQKIVTGYTSCKKRKEKEMAPIFRSFFFGWKTLKRMEDNRMGVENRLTLRLNNQLKSRLCSWFSCVVRMFDKMQFVKIMSLVKCMKLKYNSNIKINSTKQHIVIIYYKQTNLKYDVWIMYTICIYYLILKMLIIL